MGGALTTFERIQVGFGFLLFFAGSTAAAADKIQFNLGNPLTEDQALNKSESEQFYAQGHLGHWLQSGFQELTEDESIEKNHLQKFSFQFNSNYKVSNGEVGLKNRAYVILHFEPIIHLSRVVLEPTVVRSQSSAQLAELKIDFYSADALVPLSVSVSLPENAIVDLKAELAMTVQHLQGGGGETGSLELAREPSTVEDGQANWWLN